MVYQWGGMMASKGDIERLEEAIAALHTMIESVATYIADRDGVPLADVAPEVIYIRRYLE